MSIKLYRGQTFVKLKPSEHGFSLLETVIALTTLGICLAYAMPLFLYAKVNNSKSEIRTGALIVSQRIFDDIRSKSFAKMPKNDGAIAGGNAADTTLGIPANPQSIPDITSPTDAEKLITKAMGRQYQTTITYCENLTTTDPTVCGTTYRKFKVEVSYNGTKVYDLEGNFTDFQQKI